MTLTPSYGRDYKSAKEAREAFESGKDFTIASVGPNMGRQCSIRDLRGTVAEVTIRYAKLRKAVVVPVQSEEDYIADLFEQDYMNKQAGLEE